MLVDAGLQVSITGLERELHHYTLEPTETPFDLKSVPLAAQSLLELPTAPTPGETPAAVKTTEKVAATRQDVYAGESSSFGFTHVTVTERMKPVTTVC